MRLVSWNCRGLGNPSKAEAVKSLLKSELPEILMLQDTKIEGEALLEINKAKWKTKAGKVSGDKNTAFFHKQIHTRLSRNHIVEITSPNGTVLKGTTLIKEVATPHFQLLFKEEGVEDNEEAHHFLKHIPRMVNEEDNASLLKPFTEEEISNVIWKMEPDKAPRPDGFSIHFYRLCWDIIKADLYQMIKGFLLKAKVGGSTISTFLALNPKEANPKTFDRFKPISLYNTSYKILTKILANRIKPLMDKLISPNQGGFVKGRHILDNVILVQEIIHSSHQHKEQGMLIKLDMANAFDRVRHFFLLQVLSAFGFSPDCVKLIKACIGEPWIAPLVNGRLANYFKASREIRKGFHLPPFLYILMADSLS
eukprot:PITA_34935